MRALRVDFSPRTLGGMFRALPLWSWPALILGLLGCLMVAVNVWSLQKQGAPLNDEIKALERRLEARNALPHVVRHELISPQQAIGVNLAVRQLNVPWAEVLDAIEASCGPNVAMIELTPDSRKQSVRGTAEARSTSEMIAYVERLKAQGYFSTVRLIKHEVNAQDRNEPVRFQFEAPWREVMP
jgi:Tfp pilus assembly protein PilN